jgi:large subunit ribosomal protein L9
MKVILKKAVLKLGTPGEIVEVKNGYAFNFLIPQGLALFANGDNLKAFEVQKAELLAEHVKAKSIAENLKSTIDGNAVLMARTVNDAGNFYSVINSVEVAILLNKQFKQENFEFEKSQILISNKIRNYGIYDFTIALYSGVVAKMKLSIATTEDIAKSNLESKS